MENSVILPNIRIRKIIMKDFRNIVHTEVDIPGGKMSEYIDGEPSILGLYGQNGSGKTSVLMAVNALKMALSGSEFFYSDFGSCIRSGSKNARLEFEFSSYNEKGAQFDIYYAFSMTIDESETEIVNKSIDIENALDFMGYGKLFSESGKDKLSDYMHPKDKRIIIYDELLQYAAQSPEGEKNNKQVLIDTSEDACSISSKAFGNKKKYEQLTLNCESGIDEFLYKAKLESSIRSKSFIFSSKVLKALINGSSNISYKLILKALSEFGRNYLFVILMEVTAYNNMRMLPLSLWFNDKEDGACGFVFPIPLIEHCKIPDEIFPFLKEAIESISQVLSKIVPDLKIKVEDIGKTVSEKGQDIHLFDLISVRKDVRIPLVYESDGIKRILSFLCLIVAAYNNPSVTIVIDEIDSGIFEYMLGEILSIMKDSAKGQLIFTSHNLRPLEVLPHKNLLFTTVNPENRLAKLEGISGNNNLRDSYFRSIILGSGKNAFYDTTDTFNIEQAMFEAGLSMEN